MFPAKTLCASSLRRTLVLPVLYSATIFQILFFKKIMKHCSLFADAHCFKSTRVRRNEDAMKNFGLVQKKIN